MPQMPKLPQQHRHRDNPQDKKAHVLEHPVSAQVWAGVGEEGFIFPELRKDKDGVPALQKKPDFAITLSGGGFRACSCALGWMKALHRLGVVKKARFLSSNSGGSWFNCAFSYQTMVPVETFLGEYIHPTELIEPKLSLRQKGEFAETMDHATILNKTVGHTVAGALGLRSDEEHFSAWTKAVGEAFLGPVGVGEEESTFALHGESARRTKAQVGCHVDEAMRSTDMPYPIVVGAILPPHDARAWYSFEFTPMYSGVPASIGDSTPHKLGRVLVESWAVFSDPPEQSKIGNKNSSAKVRLQVKHAMPVMQAAGISSHAVSAAFSRSDAEFTWESLSFPRLPYWDGLSFTGRELGFTDGGATDNMAILPPLRRRVKKMISCCAIGHEPKGSRRDWVKAHYNLAGYFGRCPEGSQPRRAAERVDNKVYNTMLKVFEGRMLDDLVDELFALNQRGAPLIFKRTYAVLPNPVQGVSGGYDVEVLWVFNGGMRLWAEQLPERTKRKVHELVEEESAPYVPTSNLDYKPALTTVMSQLAAWNIIQAKHLITQLLAG